MIVVITGASAGIGRATAREFAARGWDVAVLARNAARLEAAADDSPARRAGAADRRGRGGLRGGGSRGRAGRARAWSDRRPG